MTYHRPWVSPRDRAGAIVAVLVLHAGVIAALLTLGGSPTALLPDKPSLEIFDVPPPVPPPPEPVVVETDAAPRKEGAAAPPAKKAEATPVVSPPPKVALPLAPPVVAAEKPGEGAAPSQGAAPVPGPGTGAGGQGSGTGSGGAGTGSGGGGSGGAGTRPALVSRSLTVRDYSSASRTAWPSGQRVLVIFDVQLNGRATNCKVFRSIGIPSIDAETCALVTRKLRFRPARDESGKPYVEKYAYEQRALF